MYRIVISTLIMTDRRNFDINIKFCLSNKWSSQIYVSNKTTKKLFKNTLITHTKMILKVLYSFFEIMPLIIYTVLTKKKVWGQPPRPLENSNQTLSCTLSQLPATKIIVRITIVIDHPSLPSKKKGFLDSYMVYSVC